MRRRSDLLILGGLATLILIVTLGPLVVGVVQVIRDPPPQHPGLALLGIVGDARDRLMWSLGGAGIVLAVWVVIASIYRHVTREHPWRVFEERSHGIGAPGRA